MTLEEKQQLLKDLVSALEQNARAMSVHELQDALIEVGCVASEIDAESIGHFAENAIRKETDMQVSKAQGIVDAQIEAIELDKTIPAERIRRISRKTKI